MAAVYRLTHRVAVGLALLGTLGMLLMVVHITLDVVLRWTLSVSVPATVELVTRYYLIAMALMPLGWVEQRRGMIAVEALEGLMTPGLMRLSDVLVVVLSVAVYVVLAVATWGKAMEQYDIGAYVMSLNVAIPVWPTYFVLPLAFGLAALVCAVRLPGLLGGEAPEPAGQGER